MVFLITSTEAEEEPTLRTHLEQSEVGVLLRRTEVEVRLRPGKEKTAGRCYPNRRKVSLCLSLCLSLSVSLSWLSD